MSKNIGLTSCLYCSERACQVAYDAIEEITRLRSDLATLRAQNYETQSLLKGAEAECDALRADAERYRWLRAQHWSDSSLCVVAHPKSNLRLGTYCPSAEALDELTDAARAALKEPK